MNRLLMALVVATAAMAPLKLDARPHRTGQIPNGNCDDMCHIFPAGPRTAFGLQVGQTLRGSDANWARLFDLDADGDSFTNGEELGDEAGLFPNRAPVAVRSNLNDAFSIPTPRGSAPRASDLDVDIDEDEIFSGSLPLEDPDQDDVHNFRLVERPTLGAVRLTDRATGEFTYTPPPNASGVDRFTYRVFDGSNLSEIAEVNVVVRDVNDPPVFSPPLPPRAEVREGGTLMVRVQIDDVEDGRLTVAHTALPPGAEFDDTTGSLSWLTEAGDAGIYEVTFSARDAGGLLAEHTLEIEVTEVNNTPELTVEGPESGQEGDTLTFDVVGTDFDGDTLAFTWAFDEEAPTTEEGLTQIVRTFTQNGRFRLSVTVSDGAEERTRQLIVTIENVRPAVDAGDDLQAEVDSPVSLSGSFVDPGDEGLHTLTWDFGDGSPPLNGQLDAIHTYSSSGVFTASFAVQDDEARVLDSLKVTVGGDPGPEAEPEPSNEPDDVGCDPGEPLSCLCPGGGIGSTTCGGDGQPAACVCGDGGGGGGGDEGCQSAPGDPSPLILPLLLLALALALPRRQQP